MSSLVTDDTKRKRSGSDDSKEETWSVYAVHNGRDRKWEKEKRRRAKQEKMPKEVTRWKALWEVATDNEKNAIWEIVKRGPKDPRGEGPKYYLKMLVHATKQEKTMISEIWKRTLIYKKWLWKWKQRKKEGLRLDGLRF